MFLMILFRLKSASISAGFKSEVISLRSKLRRLQVELDSLRNQAISDDIILSDDTNIEIVDNNE